MNDSNSAACSADPAPAPTASPSHKQRKPPRWTIAFLRALERTGQVRSAAVDAGVDYTSAYARRGRHADFGAAWAAALVSHQQRVAEDERAAIAALASAPSPGSPVAGPTSPSRGEVVRLEPSLGLGADLLASTALGGAQYKRAGAGRWGPAAERRFFDDLAATANLRRAAAAAGVSPNAVRARREKRPLFRAQWEAVLANARANIELGLVGAAERGFNPDTIDTDHIEPRVTVAEAIRIVQLHGTKQHQEEVDYYAEQAAKMSRDDIAAIRQRLVDKLQRLKRRDMPEQLAAGWSYDEPRDMMIPPGWVRAAPVAETGAAPTEDAGELDAAS